MRRPLVVANWKMNGRIGPAIELAATVKSGLHDVEGVEVVLCPPFTALKSVGDLVRYSRVGLGAQDVHWEPEGAFTGEISVGMLRDLDCEYVIVGHSERRRFFHEDDAIVRRKTDAALEGGLCPIVCVGETLEQREAGVIDEVLREQVLGSLGHLGVRLGHVVLAYEPVWAIGTGRVATVEQAQSAHATLRSLVVDLAGAQIAAGMRILYGGSVKPSSIVELSSAPDVDGGLVGGASLDAAAFVGIVRVVAGD